MGAPGTCRREHGRSAAHPRRAAAGVRRGRSSARERRHARARGLVAAGTAAALRRRERRATRSGGRRGPAAPRQAGPGRDPRAAPGSGGHLRARRLPVPARARRKAARGGRPDAERRRRMDAERGVRGRQSVPAPHVVGPPPRALRRGSEREWLMTTVRAPYGAALVHTALALSPPPAPYRALTVQRKST